MVRGSPRNVSSFLIADPTDSSMGPERRRPAADADVADVAGQTPPPTPSPFFRYTPAEENEPRNDDEDAHNTEKRKRVKYTQSLRGVHQREIDEVDIPAPTEWLRHDATISTRLRAQAQTDLQLLVPGRPSRQPHSERQGLRSRNWDAGLCAAIKSTLGKPHSHRTTAQETRARRVVCGGEVLPWGTWPTRLRHHDGQSFYRQDENIGRSLPDGPYSEVGGGSVGRNGGVGVVSESSIHDELLRRQWPASPHPPSSLVFSSKPCEEPAVTRLVPDKRGRWIEVQARTAKAPKTAVTAAEAVAAAAAAAAAALPGNNLPVSSILGTSSRQSSTPLLTPPIPTSPSGGKGAGTKCMIPGRYGGWIEFEETMNEGDKNTSWQRQRRRADVSMVARFETEVGEGEDDGRVVIVPDAALPSSYLDEERYSRQMVAKAAEEVARAAREARRQGGRELLKHQRGARVGTATKEGYERCSKEGRGGGRMEMCGVAIAGTQGMRNGCDRNTIGNSDAACMAAVEDEKAGEGFHGYRQKYWTVSNPAKETVRRVWNRARRRAGDCLQPMHSTERVRDGDGENKDTTHPVTAAAAAVDSASVPRKLDLVLLDCLGRECEGIIDAVLHVVLADRLRAQSFSSQVASSSGQDKQNSDSSQTLPPQPATADWQDVMRAMQSCSERARGVQKPTGAAAATTSDNDDSPHYSSSETGMAQGRRHQGEREEGVAGGRVGGGADGVPEQDIRRAVWGAGDYSDGSVVVVNERLPGLPLNDAVLTRAYNRLLLYLHEKNPWHA